VFEFNPHLSYMMPAHFGIPHTARTSLRYLDVTTIAISYRTDGAKLEQYLPKPLRIRDEPILTVYYQANREVEWLAGGGYNLLGVDATVRFEGEEEQIDGSFCLVLWENDPDAIVSGRELLGVPQIYADIEDHKIIQGDWSTSASNRGHTLVDIGIRDLVPVDRAGLDEMERASRAASWLGWRHVPEIGKPGAALSHATCIPSGGRPREAWIGRGEVHWHRTCWEKNPTQWHIINALADLPILEHRSAVVVRGGSTLADEGKKPLRGIR